MQIGTVLAAKKFSSSFYLHVIAVTKHEVYLHDREAESDEVVVASFLYILVVWVSIPSFFPLA
jgi:hypothetical protein